MKSRNGFVSNSSSSSFICKICECEIYHDIQVICPNGHSICMSHIKGKIEYEPNQIDPDFNNCCSTGCGNCSGSCASNHTGSWTSCYDDSDDDLDKITTNCCPICQFELVSNEELLVYLLFKLNTDKTKAMQGLKDEFKDYRTFSEFVDKNRTLTGIGD